MRLGSVNASVSNESDGRGAGGAVACIRVAVAPPGLTGPVFSDKLLRALFGVPGELLNGVLLRDGGWHRLAGVLCTAGLRSNGGGGGDASTPFDCLGVSEPCRRI
jgi:hypothetical protein